MGKVGYLMKRIAKLDYKNMIKIAKAVSKKAKKPTLFIMCDMVNCGLKYQAGYYDYQEFEFYLLNKKERPTYLTRGKNNQIIQAFNDRESFHKFNDKVEFNSLFKKFLKRNWMVIDEDNFETFKKFLKDNKTIIVKPIDGEGGAGIEKFNDSKDLDYRNLYEKLLKNKQLLVEECIVQHKDMNKLYDKSVNTMRMYTFYKDGNSYFLQAILKFGNGSVVDNFSSGGMYTFVNDEGFVYVPAIDKADKIYEEHPISKETIRGFEVPCFKEAVELVKECAKVVPEVGYVGWDVAISKDGPVLVEGNCFPGVFQPKPSLVDKKEGVIPKYNKCMKIFSK